MSLPALVGNNSPIADISNPTLLNSTLWAQFDTQLSHTLSIRNDGLLFGWGNNQYGQIGDATTLYRSVPVQIGSSSWTAVSAGKYHSLAIRSDGALFAWGIGGSGRLGDGTTVNKSSPVQIGSSSWIAVATSRFTSAAIRLDNKLFTWGYNGYGQLGVGDFLNRSSPTVVKTYTSSPTQIGDVIDFFEEEWSSVSLGYGVTAAIRKKDSKLFTWGNSLTYTNQFLTTGFVTETKSWTSIAAGRSHAVAIRSDGLLFTWGIGNYGVLGDSSKISSVGYGVVGEFASKYSPVQIGSSSWTAVSIHRDTNAAIRSDGGLFMWGAGRYYILGGLKAPIDTWTTVSAGYNHTLAIKSDGTLWTWGRNNFGQHGVGDTNTSFLYNIETPYAPVQVGASSWTAISSGHYFSVAIRNDGALFGWGRNQYGQIGDGTTVNKISPVQIGSSSWTAIKAGHFHCSAIRSDGALFTWGRNDVGQIGDGSSGNSSSPVQIGSSSWIVVGAGYKTTGGITSNYKMFLWGENTYGVVGDNTTSNKFIPFQIGSSSWTAISVGKTHSAAIRSDGALFAWGKNQYGQIGDGTTVNKSSPVQIGSSSWTMVNIPFRGNPRTHAIRDDGKLFSWGNGFNGELGIDSCLQVGKSPVQVGNNSWKFVNAGAYITLGINGSDNLYSWGWTFASGLYDRRAWWTSEKIGSPLIIGGHNVVRLSSPVQIGSSSWTAVSLGKKHVLAIREDGGLFAWGYNGLRQLGVDYHALFVSSPVQIGSSSWTAVAAGYNSSSALRTDGGLFTWGLGNYGEVPITTEIKSWTSIGQGINQNGYAIRSDGLLFGWGSNTYGELGIGGEYVPFSANSPMQVGSSSWTQVSSGKRHTIAIRSDGALFTWGLNRLGVLGNNSKTPYKVMSPIQIGSSSWTAVSAGYSHSVAIRSDGALFSWGMNRLGQLGQNYFGGPSDEYEEGISSPVQIGSSSWTAISSGGYHTFAIRTDGRLFAWGAGGSGRLGDGTTVDKSSPVQIGSSSWTAVSAGRFHTVAIRSGGTLFTWGINSSGQIGDGTTVDKSSPVQIGSSSWTAVSAGHSHVVAIRSGGTLFAWGAGGSGRLGDGTTVNKSSPVQIGSSSWTAVSGGWVNSWAIRSDNILFGWGQGSRNGMSSANISSPVQIGGNITTTIPTPTQLGSSSWTAISGSFFHRLAIKSDGTLFAFGRNNRGQIGDGTTVDKSSPVQIGSSSWTAVSTGRSHTVAIRSGGTLFTWGLNDRGQIGDGTTVNKSSPVQIGSSSWTAVSAGGSYSVTAAITNNNLLFAWGDGNVSGQGQLQSAFIFSSPVSIGNTPQGFNLPSEITSSSPNFHPSTWRQVKLNGPSRIAALGFVNLVEEYAIGIREDGTLYSWGKNKYGQLGDGTTVEKKTPVLVGSGWNKVSTGTYHVAALKPDGTLFTWGRNNKYQLGDGTSINRSSPVQIGSFKWNAISAGDLNTFGT